MAEPTTGRSPPAPMNLRPSLEQIDDEKIVSCCAMAVPPRKLAASISTENRPAALEPSVRVREDARQRRSAPSDELLFFLQGASSSATRGACYADQRWALTLSGLRMRYRFEDYVLDTDRRELCRRGDVGRASSRKVFDLLEYLIENRERVVSRDDLIAAVWDGRIVSELGADHPHQRGALRDRRHWRGAAPDQDRASQGHPLRGQGAGGAGSRPSLEADVELATVDVPPCAFPTSPRSPFSPSPT